VEIIKMLAGREPRRMA